MMERPAFFPEPTTWLALDVLPLFGSRLTTASRDAGRVQSQIGEQFGAFAMLDESVWYSQSPNVMRGDVSVGCRFEHGTTEASGKRGFLDGYYKCTVADSV